MRKVADAFEKNNADAKVEVIVGPEAKWSKQAKSGMRIVVTEGAGVYNTSGTGVWEDVASRLGRLEDVTRFRKHIIAFAKGGAAGYKAFQKQDADAWITCGRTGL